jgi:hypothetical protein
MIAGVAILVYLHPAVYDRNEAPSRYGLWFGYLADFLRRKEPSRYLENASGFPGGAISN